MAQVQNVEISIPMIGKVEVFRSKKLLRLEKNPLEIQVIIDRFLNGNTFKEERIEAKNNLLIHLLENNDFLMSNNLVFENSCSHCGGKGFRIKFHTKELKCPDCVDGFKTKPCRTCEGTGFLKGAGPCITCYNPLTHKSTGVYVYRKTKFYPGNKCLTCRGTAKKIKLISKEGGKIDSFYWCDRCNKRGISNEIGERVLGFEDAEKLKLKINEKFNGIYVVK